MIHVHTREEGRPRRADARPPTFRNPKALFSLFASGPPLPKNAEDMGIETDPCRVWWAKPKVRAGTTDVQYGDKSKEGWDGRETIADQNLR